MTSQTNPKTIELYGQGCQHEAQAAANVTPGMLVERAGGDVQAHSTVGEGGNTHFANEFDMTGQTIDDVYETGDQVVFTTYAPGSGVYAILNDGNDVSEDDFLVSAGNGRLQLQAGGTTQVVVAQAREAVNASGTNERIRVEVVAPFTRTTST